MAVLEAYLDESGTHASSKVTIVAGGLAKRSSWLSMAGQWSTVLERFGISLFHASDFSSGHGEFDGWSEDKRRDFLSMLLSILNREQMEILGMGLHNETYIRVKKEFLDVKLDAYQCCCEMAVGWLAAHLQHKKHVQSAFVFFEAGRSFVTPTIQYYQELGQFSLKKDLGGIRSITLLKKQDAIPLQVADLIAYELYKYQSQGGVAAKPIVRYPLQIIGRLITETSGLMLTENRIRDYLEITKHFVARRNAESK